MNSVTFIIFGATGDLVKRKIIPALYRLAAHKKIKDFIIIGAAIDDVDAQIMLQSAKQYVHACNNEVWDMLEQRSFYKKVSFTIEHDFVSLCEYVVALEQQYNLPGNRLFFCATAPSFFCPITQAIATVGLAKKYDVHDSVWNRIVYEKPFGHNVESAHEINICIKKYFNETQIYRIDHYLTKGVVSNIVMIRFTNMVLEPLWSYRYIEEVQIILSETVGVELRGGYYDHFGALRDMVQNHALELLALICMEAPQKLTGNFIRDERVKVLQHTRCVDGIIAQYEGYRSEKDVNPQSRTETYAAITCAVDTPRWEGVPFYIKTGKCLDKKETIIHIKFKQAECLLLEGCPVESNWLTLKIAPEALFVLTLNAKHPLNNTLISVDMEFCHSCLFGLYTPESYEVILSEVIKGEQSISIRFDEIEYAWNIIDSIKTADMPIFTYTRASSGPYEAKEFEKKHSMKWRE